MSRCGTIGVAAGLVVLAGAVQAAGPTIDNGVAVLQGLDKVTARVSPVRAALGVPI